MYRSISGLFHWLIGSPLFCYFLPQTPKDGYFYRYDVEMILQKTGKQKGPGDAKTKSGPGGAGGGGAVRELPKHLKRKIINIFVKQNQEAGFLFHGIVPVYDGQKQLYTMKDLNIKTADGVSFTVNVPADEEGGARSVVVVIKPCQPYRVAWRTLYDAVEGRTQDNPIVVIQLINTVFREAAMATATNIAVNRSFFTREMNDPVYIGAGREIWSGFYSVGFFCGKFTVINCLTHRLIASLRRWLIHRSIDWLIDPSIYRLTRKWSHTHWTPWIQRTLRVTSLKLRPTLAITIFKTSISVVRAASSSQTSSLD